MKKIYFLFFLIISFGCEKEVPEIFSYPSILISREYKIMTEVKLFTKRGQINDKTVIGNYLNKVAPGIFYQNKDAFVPINKPDTLNYYSTDTVLFSIPGIWGKRVAKQEGSYLFFYMPDTLIGFKSLQQDSEFKSIINGIGIYKPYYNDLHFYGSIYQEVFNAFIARGNPNRLEFPQITYRITRRGNNSYYAGYSSKNYNNVFDPNVLKLLQEGDTLAIQEAKIVYLKHNK
jgi:hypothetical protein